MSDPRVGGKAPNTWVRRLAAERVRRHDQPLGPSGPGAKSEAPLPPEFLPHAGDLEATSRRIFAGILGAPTVDAFERRALAALRPQLAARLGEVEGPGRAALAKAIALSLERLWARSGQAACRGPALMAVAELLRRDSAPDLLRVAEQCPRLIDSVARIVAGLDGRVGVATALALLPLLFGPVVLGPSLGVTPRRAREALLIQLFVDATPRSGLSPGQAGPWYDAVWAALQRGSSPALVLQEAELEVRRLHRQAQEDLEAQLAAPVTLPPGAEVIFERVQGALAAVVGHHGGASEALNGLIYNLRDRVVGHLHRDQAHLFEQQPLFGAITRVIEDLAPTPLAQAALEFTAAWLTRATEVQGRGGLGAGAPAIPGPNTGPARHEGPSSGRDVGLAFESIRRWETAQTAGARAALLLDGLLRLQLGGRGPGAEEILGWGDRDDVWRLQIALAFRPEDLDASSDPQGQGLLAAALGLAEHPLPPEALEGLVNRWRRHRLAAEAVGLANGAPRTRAQIALAFAQVGPRLVAAAEEVNAALRVVLELFPGMEPERLVRPLGEAFDRAGLPRAHLLEILPVVLTPLAQAARRGGDSAEVFAAVEVGLRWAARLARPGVGPSDAKRERVGRDLAAAFLEPPEQAVESEARPKEGEASLSLRLEAHALPPGLAITARRRLSAPDQSWVFGWGGGPIDPALLFGLELFLDWVLEDEEERGGLLAAVRAQPPGSPIAARLVRHVADAVRAGRGDRLDRLALVEALRTGRDPVAEVEAQALALVLPDLPIAQSSAAGRASIQAGQEVIVELLDQAQSEWVQGAVGPRPFLSPLREVLRAVAEGRWPATKYEDAEGPRLDRGLSPAQQLTWRRGMIVVPTAAGSVPTPTAGADPSVLGALRRALEGLARLHPELRGLLDPRQEEELRRAFTSALATPRDRPKAQRREGHAARLGLGHRVALFELGRALEVAERDPAQAMGDLGWAFERARSSLTSLGATLALALGSQLPEPSRWPGSRATPLPVHAIDEDGLLPALSYATGDPTDPGGPRAWARVNLLVQANEKVLTVYRAGRPVDRAHLKLLTASFEGYRGPVLWANPPLSRRLEAEARALLEDHLLHKAQALGVPLVAAACRVDRAAARLGRPVRRQSVILELPPGPTGACDLGEGVDRAWRPSTGDGVGRCPVEGWVVGSAREAVERP